MRIVKGKKWIIVFIALVAAGMIAFMIANYVIDPVDYFAATSNKETYNPNNYTRKIKTEYIIKRFPDVEGIFLGGSKAGVLDPVRMGHYTGLSYYNLSYTHGNFSDYETWTRFLLEHLDNLKEITIHLSSIEAGYFSWYRDVYPADNTGVPAIVTGNLWQLITENLSYLCTDIRTLWKGFKNPDSGITRDTLATGQKNWRAAIRRFSEDPAAYLEKNFYSFATKYCSHHNPLDYPIYDSYVDVILRYFRNRDAFSSFADSDLKDYVHFKGALIDFRMFYGLQEYNLKLIDRYIWLLGKEYFPKNYGKKG